MKNLDSCVKNVRLINTITEKITAITAKTHAATSRIIAGAALMKPVRGLSGAVPFCCGCSEITTLATDIAYECSVTVGCFENINSAQASSNVPITAAYKKWTRPRMMTVGGFFLSFVATKLKALQF